MMPLFIDKDSNIINAADLLGGTHGTCTECDDFVVSQNGPSI